MKVLTKRLSNKVLLAGLIVAALTLSVSRAANTSNLLFMHDISPGAESNPNSPPCLMPGSDAAGNIVVGGIGDVETLKVTRCKIVLTCKGKNLRNDSGRKQSFSGFACGIDVDGNGTADYVTYDSYATVSKKGVGFMTCTVKLPCQHDNDDDDEEEDDDDDLPSDHHNHYDHD
jgi:hypothetical protein